MEKLDLEFLNSLIDDLLEAKFLFEGCSPQLRGKWKANLEERREALVSYVESLQTDYGAG